MIVSTDGAWLGCKDDVGGHHLKCINKGNSSGKPGVTAVHHQSTHGSLINNGEEVPHLQMVGTH